MNSLTLIQALQRKRLLSALKAVRNIKRIALYERVALYESRFGRSRSTPNIKSKHSNVVHRREELRWRHTRDPQLGTSLCGTLDWSWNLCATELPVPQLGTSLCGTLDWSWNLCATELPVTCQHCLAMIKRERK